MYRCYHKWIGTFSDHCQIFSYSWQLVALHIYAILFVHRSHLHAAIQIRRPTNKKTINKKNWILIAFMASCMYSRDISNWADILGSPLDDKTI